MEFGSHIPIGSRTADIVVASNRGPVGLTTDINEGVQPRRGAGGLIAIVGAALANSGGVWVAATSDATDNVSRPEDERAPAGGVDPGSQLHTVDLQHGRISVRMLELDPEVYRAYYERISSRTLWFLHHQMFDLARSPIFGASFRTDWRTYEQVNELFAAACADEVAPGGTVLLQDYHLATAPAMLRARRTDVSIVHCTMCPWAEPGYFATLPTWAATRLIDGMLGADVVSFFVPRWARCFMRSCADLGYEVDWGSWRVESRAGKTRREARVRALPVGVDADHLRAQVAAPACRAEARAIGELVGNRRLILRVDRLDPSKNILRGLAGFESFLATNPGFEGRVVHYVLAYSSRAEVPEYQRYARDVSAAVDTINRRFRTETWEPIILDTRNNIDRALALMARADVIIVNPLRDGMNLVAKEAVAVSQHDVAVILSQHAGAADDLAPGALMIDPFDAAELAEAIATALAFSPRERSRRIALLQDAASTPNPRQWLDLVLAEVRHATRAH